MGLRSTRERPSPTATSGNARHACPACEVAAFQPDGRSSFQALQYGGVVFGFVLFDLVYLDGRDLQSRPRARRALVAAA